MNIRNSQQEFDRKVLEVLREPLESGHITISRAARQADFPARFQLIAAMNPCPCGYYGHYNHRCRCTPDQIARYQSRISGPLLDRIDMYIEVPALKAEELGSEQPGEHSPQIRARVMAARARQQQRQQTANAMLAAHAIGAHCQPSAAASQLLQVAMQKLALSARTYHRILKVARTIADLADSPIIEQPHLAEALQYRRLEHAR